MSGKSNNIFAALQTKKSTKKVSVKEDADEPKEDNHAELEKAIFSTTATGISNWADDSEDEWEAHARHPAAEQGWNQVRTSKHSK